MSEEELARLADDGCPHVEDEAVEAVVVDCDECEGWGCNNCLT